MNCLYSHFVYLSTKSIFSSGGFLSNLFSFVFVLHSNGVERDDVFVCNIVQSTFRSRNNLLFLSQYPFKLKGRNFLLVRSKVLLHFDDVDRFDNFDHSKSRASSFRSRIKTPDSSKQKLFPLGLLQSDCYLRFLELPILGTKFSFATRFEKSVFHCTFTQ